MWAVLLLALQAKGLGLQDYVKAVPTDKRADLLDAIDYAVKVGDAPRLEDEARRFAWKYRLPVLSAALEKRKGASLILRALCMGDGPGPDVKMDDLRSIYRFAIQAVAPFAEDADPAARLPAARFLTKVAAISAVDDLGKTVSPHAPETRALLRKALLTASRDDDRRVVQEARQGLDHLDAVER